MPIFHQGKTPSKNFVIKCKVQVVAQIYVIEHWHLATYPAKTARRLSIKNLVGNASAEICVARWVVTKYVSS
jgi:hypothetical protein